ncbi:outer membrane lipoprotein carrier protein LolA [Sphingomonas sp. BN140010]|uniref:Outer membrane lipoprotein carrier protein LolA n=1 Tax=Sphingomonas arvum TaxID=2992113 RepID=A0ABT3JF64_9SPHN|nr:outer membrane lipoprotein carrier protein LolA [Sphingomonas sp. BN140010]MCW3797717.1 outer membrane lipoprotein carrier protein LolA [Sphingomonas sp. BN140010]
MIFIIRSARFLAFVAAVALGGTGSVALAQSDAGLAQVQRSLAATQSLSANFIQTDQRNRSLRGTLQLKRPGKVRFAYGSGANMLMVADGKRLTFIDYDVGQKSSWGIANSPLSVLLSPQPNLNRIARTIASGDPRVVLVRARDARRPEFGTIILAFAKNGTAPGGLQLEGWTAIDAQNKRTTVKLDGQRYNVPVPDGAFTYAEPKRRK